MEQIDSNKGFENSNITVTSKDTDVKRNSTIDIYYIRNVIKQLIDPVTNTITTYSNIRYVNNSHPYTGFLNFWF
jgi:hypothetical protein